MFQYFLARRQEYARLFLDPRNAEAKEIFREEFARVLTEQTLHHPAFTAYTREEIVVLCQFFAGGLLSLITWWLKPVSLITFAPKRAWRRWQRPSATSTSSMLPSLSRRHPRTRPPHKPKRPSLKTKRTAPPPD